MNEHLDGQMNMDRWMNGLSDKQTDIQNDRQTDQQVYRLKDGQTDRGKNV